MKRTSLAALASLAALGAASAASAATTVIDFSELAFNSPGPYGEPQYTSLTSQGFVFTNSLNRLTVRSRGHYATIDPAGTALTTSLGGVTRVARTDGQAFNLGSFAFADYYNEGVPPFSFTLSFFDGVSQGTRTLTYDAMRGVQVADLQLRNIQWFSISNTQVQLDNIRVSEVPTAAVPEPSAWALMILGFGAAGAVLRRRPTVMTA